MGVHESRVLCAVVVTGAVLTAATPNFLTWRNLLNLLDGYATPGIFAVGLLVVLISGGIDMSFTATAAVTQYVMAKALVGWGGTWAEAFVLSASLGCVIGAVNGLLIHRLRVSAIIITIATLNVLFGVLMFVTGGTYITDLPDWFTDGVTFLSFSDSDGNAFSVSLQTAALVAAFAFTAFLLQKTALGRQVYALGGNPEAAGRIGINVGRLHVLIYGYMGALAGIAGVTDAQLAQTVAPSALVGTELDVLAAVLLGGASLTGGVGSVTGTFLGLALLAELQNGMVLVGVSSYWARFLVGGVIILSSAATALSQRTRAGVAFRV
jgi:simple sugar transport system permease protein